MKSAIRAGTLALAVLGAGVTFAQPGGGPGRGGPGGDRPRYDPAAVTTIQGQVAEVKRVQHGRGAGVHLVVSSDGVAVPVHLGPDFYVDEQAVKLAKGDAVEVKGARVEVAGEQVILAAEVRRGDEVLRLRDADGLPLWRRGRR